MANDEIIISDSSTGSPRFRATVEDDRTVIRDFATNAPRFVLDGKIGGDTVKVMTTEERIAITPEAGQLIYDTTLGLLFVGDGSTQGGTAVGGGGGGGGTVTGIEASVSDNTATIAATGSTTSVKFVGVDGTTISEGDNGEIQIGGGGGGGGVVPGYRLSDDETTLNFNPIQPIVNVTGSSVTLVPDTAYRMYATTGALNATANPPAANYWGLEGHAEIFVGSVGYVVFDTSKIVLANQLEPDSVNNCTLRFHDGMCYISVEDHIAGYIVVNGSTSGEGSLYYGISTSTNDYVAFDASLNGQPIPLAGAVAEGEKHIVGNGYTETEITGAVDCGENKVTVANLGLNDVQITGGTLIFGDAFIPSGSTVAVSGGGLAIEKVTGAGSDSVVDMGATRFVLNAGSSSYASGCMFRNGYTTGRGGFTQIVGSMTLDNCTISGCTATLDYGGGINVNSGKLNLISSFVSGNSSPQNDDVYINNTGLARYQDCTVYKTTLNNGALSLAGSNTLNFIRFATSSGSVTLTSGAILDLTGNTNATPIAPGGGITFEPGGATVLYSSGAASGSYMMDNVTLPAGAKLTNTAMVDLGYNAATQTGGTNIEAINASVYISGVDLTNGHGRSLPSYGVGVERGGAIHVVGASGYAYVYGSTISGNNGGNNGGGIALSTSAKATLVNVTVTNNTATAGDCIYIGSGQITASNCVLGGGSYLQTANASLIFTGSNTYSSGDITGNGIVTLTYGAILDLTGNTTSTPIKPGGVIVDGGCQVITSAGSTVSIAGGTYTKINNDGTTN